MKCCPCFTITDTNPVETLPEGWKTAEVGFFHRNGKKETRIEIIDPNGMRYVHEEMGVTAIKCFMLLIGTPIFLGLNIFWHALRTPIATLAAPLVSLVKLIRNPTWIQTKEFVKDLLWNIPLFFIKGMWNIVRAPFYAIAMEFAALYGVFKPIEGRSLIAKIERGWHRLSRVEDIRYEEKEVDCSLILKVAGDKDFHATFYLAHCMQPFGNLSDQSTSDPDRLHIDPCDVRVLEPGSIAPKVGLWVRPGEAQNLIAQQ